MQGVFSEEPPMTTRRLNKKMKMGGIEQADSGSGLVSGSVSTRGER